MDCKQAGCSWCSRKDECEHEDCSNRGVPTCTPLEFMSPTAQEGRAAVSSTYKQILTDHCYQQRQEVLALQDELSLPEKEQESEEGSRLSPYPFRNLFEERGTSNNNQQLPSCTDSTELV